jgi:GR25 family glycosyltransferase involved in LPS biosynthesis
MLGWNIDEVKTFCISLDRRPDRYNRMIIQPEIKKLPNFKKFSGVDGQTLDIKTDPRVTTLCRYNIMNHTRRSHDLLDSIGGVGCALSHITLWQNLLKSNDNVFLVVEDDLVLQKGDWEKVRQLYLQNKWVQDSNSWDIWSIGNLRCIPEDKNIKKENKFIFCKEFVGFNSYFISRRGAEKLVKEAFPIQQHIDWYASYYAQTHPDFKIVYNKSFNLDQDPELLEKEHSDIRTKDTCYICDIPTDYEKMYTLVSKSSISANTVITVMALAILYAGVIAAKKVRFF